MRAIPLMAMLAVGLSGRVLGGIPIFFTDSFFLSSVSRLKTAVLTPGSLRLGVGMVEGQSVNV